MDETMAIARGATGITPGSALGFVVLIGVVSLFADMTYEGARSGQLAAIPLFLWAERHWRLASPAGGSSR